MNKKLVIALLSISCVVLFCIFQTIYSPSSFTNFSNTDVTTRSANVSYVGPAPFAITKKDFNCQSFLSSVDSLEKFPLSFLYNTFGNDFDCVKTVMQDPRLVALQVHLINEPGHRNGRLGSYEFLRAVSSPSKYNQLLLKRDAALKRRFMNYVKPVQDLLAGFLSPNTECIITPGLESNISPQAGRTLISWGREAFPQCKINWNPINPKFASVKNTQTTGADFVEQHTATPVVQAPCIVNLDGTDIAFPTRPSLDSENDIGSARIKRDYVEKYSYCKYVFLWVGEYNCVKKGSFIDPRRRVCNNVKIDKLMGSLFKSL